MQQTQYKDLKKTFLGVCQPSSPVQYFITASVRSTSLFRSEKETLGGVWTAAEDQVLNNKTKVMLFGHWNRLETALQDPESDIKQCDVVRLLLYPSSQHKSE